MNFISINHALFVALLSLNHHPLWSILQRLRHLIRKIEDFCNAHIGVGRHPIIQTNETRSLPLSCLLYPNTDLTRRFPPSIIQTSTPLRSSSGTGARYFDVNIDSIKHGARDAFWVAGYGLVRAGAGLSITSVKTTWLGMNTIDTFFSCRWRIERWFRRHI